MKGYEFFDHTADIGIRAQSKTLSELFILLARGLVELLAENSDLKPEQTRSVELSADAVEPLLLAWLNELLFWFSTERFLSKEYELSKVTQTTLRGKVRGEIFDPSRHVQGREVKAITRHMLEVKKHEGIWYGQVIVDI